MCAQAGYNLCIYIRLPDSEPGGVPRLSVTRIGYRHPIIRLEKLVTLSALMSRESWVTDGIWKTQFAHFMFHVKVGIKSHLNIFAIRFMVEVKDFECNLLIFSSEHCQWDPIAEHA